MITTFSSHKISCEGRRIAICFAILFLILCFGIISYAQEAPEIEWQKCLGGTAFDIASSIQQTTDNGFIVAGRSYSNDDDVTGNHGSSDFWVVKLDVSQNIEWEKSFGGSDEDEGYYIQQTADGGFIFCGATASDDGDVTGFHGNFDCWILKLDASGNLQWQHALGGSDHEHTQCIQQTPDGGYIVAGHSMSTDGDVLENHGSGDYWILKLDADGNILWQNSLGGSDQDFTTSIQQTFDKGFIVAGWSASNDGDVSGNHGSRDYWVVRLDSVGNLVWQKSLGGSNQEVANYVRQTDDGGFIVAGYSASNDGDVSGNHGNWDYWIVKLDADGNLLWQKSLGGSGRDEANAIQQTIDGGFIVAGATESTDGDVSGNHGGEDGWVVKLDGEGNLVWQKSIGGSGDDKATFIQQAADGTFNIAGGSNSNDDDVSGNHGDQDCWIVKLASDIPTEVTYKSIHFISVYPNPVDDHFVISLPTSLTHFKEENIRVQNAEGKIFAMPTVFHDSQIQFNTTDLPKGFFILKIYNENEMVQVAKFIKQ